ncbi:hypothetical protein QFZ27_002771 [Inquilinus ginsengisoli]|uniref:hypothetical protein n=1 Tax=Inquilinus ginsengisoli TaxID=363840 RepID=UPI003D25757D
MKHRRGPFSEDIRAALRPGPHRITDAIRARREEVIWGAQELGLGDDETDALLRAGLDTAERRVFGDAGKDR